MKNIAIVLGTRPEAIKFAPLVARLRNEESAGKARLKVFSTGQHREMLRQAFDFFRYKPDADLDIMVQKQSLNAIAATVLARLELAFSSDPWDWVVVQGDTTTAAAAAWCASNRRIPVAHLEAGLRTGDRTNPFPEETNRKIISSVADLHFAPTNAARDALLREGVPDKTVVVTGNTVIDALLWARDRVAAEPSLIAPELLDLCKDSRRVVVITGHRRESFGKGLDSICAAIAQLANLHRDVLFVYPVHLNPNVQEPVYRMLADLPNVKLLPPLAYPSFVWLLDRSYLVLTDSGGVQEEGPSLGKPVLVMRETTERPEGVAAGNARLVGVETMKIVEWTSRLLLTDSDYQAMATALNPYGDGRAADRVAAALMGQKVPL